MDGNNGFTSEGLTRGDLLGISIEAAGDFNGDGVDDMIAGSPDGAVGDDGNGGEVYVIFGTPTSRL